LLPILSPTLIQMDTTTIDGNLKINIFGGTGSYIYECLKNGQPYEISQTEPVLSENGIYSLSVTDENDCTVTFGNIKIEKLTPSVNSPANNLFNVYVQNRKIIIENASASVRILDIVGRTVAHGTAGEFNVPQAGVYLVKVGEVVRKVVVR